MPDRSSDPKATLSTRRTIAASPQAIFSRFADPAALARWWGPDGFTNTFETFEFEPGGRWVFVMHGPNGIDYANECVFRIVQPDSEIVIEHVVEPWFVLTVKLKPQDHGTLLTWDQEFGTPEMAEKVAAICGPANEQNLNRLEAELSAVRL
ncbi:polyketide cyclase [bacterium]|nr:polyketide cyclase [bacterium]